MKIKAKDFQTLIDKAAQASSSANIRPVIAKELLHYDILFCLDQKGLLDSLVFQGGTALRLCYGGNRFSEDLDFAGGKDFSSQQLTDMKSCIEDYIGTRYRLEVTVKEPASLKQEPKYAELQIDKWLISVTTPPSPLIQKIKIEIANVPAHTRQPLSLRKNYDFLPDGYEEILIYTEMLDEIMADKLVSLSATQNYIRYRDIWDLAWLKQQGVELDADLVQKKLIDYQIDNFAAKLDKRLTSIPTILDGQRDLLGKDFKNEMQRFLPSDVYKRTLGQAKFNEYLQQTISSLLKTLKNELYSDGSTTETFRM